MNKILNIKFLHYVLVKINYIFGLTSNSDDLHIYQNWDFIQKGDTILVAKVLQKSIYFQKNITEISWLQKGDFQLICEGTLAFQEVEMSIGQCEFLFDIRD